MSKSNRWVKMAVACALAAAIMLIGAGAAPVSAQQLGIMKTAALAKPAADLTSPKFQLAGEMRRLWNDHIMWTGHYVVSAIAGLEDQQPVLARLLRNQQDIGNAIKPYYGEAAGNQLATLLQQHIQIAGQVVEAAKAGNTADLNRYNAQWHRNADDIARFLAAANPNWNEKQLKDMLYMHLQLLTDQVAARLRKDWQADILAIDKNQRHMQLFADMLTAGIIKQFPKQFP